MSKIIKKSINSTDSDDVVPIEISSYENKSLKKSNTKNRPKVTLDFNKSIESYLADWKRKIEDCATRIDESVVSQAEEAYNKGYEKGYKEGIEKELTDREKYIDSNFADKIKVIESLLSEAKKKNEEASRGLEKKIIKLSINIAEILIRKSLEIDPSTVESIVAEAMSYLISSENLILKVSHEDFKVIKSKYEKWLSLAGNVKEFKIEIDRTLSPGDCLIETDGGIIDASISNRLEILAEELLKVNQ